MRGTSNREHSLRHLVPPSFLFSSRVHRSSASDVQQVQRLSSRRAPSFGFSSTKADEWASIEKYSKRRMAVLSRSLVEPKAQPGEW